MGKLASSMQKNKRDHYLTPHTNINSKWIRHEHKTRNQKAPRINESGKLLGIGLGNDFSNVTPKIRATKIKINKWDYLKLNSSAQ